LSYSRGIDGGIVDAAGQSSVGMPCSSTQRSKSARSTREWEPREKEDIVQLK